MTSQFRLMVPAPDAGWLTLRQPARADRRRAAAKGWRLSADLSVVAAQLPELGPASALVLARPRKTTPVGEPGIHAGEDVRPSWHQVRDALKGAGISVVAERLILGHPGEDLIEVHLKQMPEVHHG